jgi:cytochrome c556
MNVTILLRRHAIGIGAAAMLTGGAIAAAYAQNATPAEAPRNGPSPSKQAVESRKAAFTLIANSFRYFGAVAKGAAPYDDAQAAKRAARIALLASIPSEAFPDGSNVGEPESKAKADIWSNRAAFDKKLKEFEEHATSLQAVVAKEKGATEAFKTAVAALGQDCKGCHDDFKLK